MSLPRDNESAERTRRELVLEPEQDLRDIALGELFGFQNANTLELRRRGVSEEAIREVID